MNSGFGRKDVVEHLLQTGANVHARDDGGLIPLHNACSFGHAEVVSLLLCQGADPNARDNWNYTPLHEAAIKGKIDVCIVLLQHGADPNIRNTDGKSALDLADPSAKAVLTDKSGGNKPSDVVHWYECRVMLLHLEPMVVLYIYILKNCEEYHLSFRNALPLFGKLWAKERSAVLYASERGTNEHRKLVIFSPIKKICIALNNDIHQYKINLFCAVSQNGDVSLGINRYEVPAYVCVCLQLRTHLFQCLSSAAVGFKVAVDQRVVLVQGEYKKDELLEAARSGNEEKLMALLTPLNVNCHASDGRKSTPLHLAAGYNRVRIVQLLLQHGADVHAKDKGGLVPLHNACSYGHYEVTELLLKHGACVNAMDLWQFTPLHEAASKNRVEVCSLLLSHGADPTLVNCHGKSAVDMAPTPELRERLTYEFKGHSLLQAAREADLAKVKKTLALEIINFKQPQSHETALHCAVASAHPKRKQVTELLLRKGANVNEKNKDFMTPLHVAAEKAHNDVMEVLHKHGAKGGEKKIKEMKGKNRRKFSLGNTV
ncbi:hypothetical protein WISP_126086 [Willisornis vidua]|uniref:TNKS1 protein n=1 Tax=Willisornis vidua TaxID=1566151 RepID=A0ABQ9CW48_9PASS|nr:hypothetical protein WISP_126086 [Willisornis vidua]